VPPDRRGRSSRGPGRGGGVGARHVRPGGHRRDCIYSKIGLHYAVEWRHGAAANADGCRPNCDRHADPRTWSAGELVLTAVILEASADRDDYRADTYSVFALAICCLASYTQPATGGNLYYAAAPIGRRH